MKSKKMLSIKSATLLICLVACLAGVSVKAQVPSMQVVQLPGVASHLAVGANGALWSLGTIPVPGGHNILFWANNMWNPVDGGAVKIAVDPNGFPWVVNSEGKVYHREGNYWIQAQGLPFIKDMVIGTNGVMYAIGGQDQVYQLILSVPMNQPVTIQTDQYDRERAEREERERRERERERERAAQQPVVVGCRNAVPMPDGDFQSAISTISNQSFDDTKLSTAKQIAGANCLSTGEIGQILGQLTFEDRKLTFAKFAYDHCVDPQNYFRLNSLFTFSNNVDALNSFVQSKQ